MNNKKSFMGNLMLFLASMIWGLAFVAQRQGSFVMDSIAFNEFRYIFAVGVLGLYILISDLIRKKMGKKVSRFNRTTLLAGALTGLVLLSSSMAQQAGIETTSAGKSGFITAMYVAVVPIICVFMRRRTSIMNWFAVVICVMGFWFMCVSESMTLSRGDVLMFLSAVTFAIQLMLIELFGKDCDPIKFTFIEFVTAAILGLPLMAINGFPSAEEISGCIVPLLYLGLLSSGVAYALEAYGQRTVKPTYATLILCLESVFALFGGIIILKETSSVRELAGCLCVFIAIFVAKLERAPRFLEFRNYKFYKE